MRTWPMIALGGMGGSLPLRATNRSGGEDGGCAWTPAGAVLRAILRGLGAILAGGGGEVTSTLRHSLVAVAG